jgi:hypothetical protein
MKRMTAFRVSTAATLVLVGLTTASAADAAAPTPPAVGEQQVDGVLVKNAPQLADRTALLHYIATNSTMTTLDVATGALVSVEAGPIAPLHAATRSPCAPGDAAWLHAGSPYRDACFFGSAGRVASPKTLTRQFVSGRYTASGEWEYLGMVHSTPRQAPDSAVQFKDGEPSGFAVSGTIY